MKGCSLELTPAHEPTLATHSNHFASFAPRLLLFLLPGLWSPACAAHTLLGSCVGVGTALAIGAAPAEIGAGLWGFNPALTALAVSVFFVPSTQSYALATGSSAATAVLFGGAKVAMGTAFGVPALTLPFCAVAAGNHLIAMGGARGLVLAAAPHSPEKNMP